MNERTDRQMDTMQAGNKCDASSQHKTGGGIKIK